MPADRELRATFISGRTAWVVVIGMVLALAGGSFSMLPAASAQDEREPTPVESDLIVLSPTSTCASVIAQR